MCIRRIRSRRRELVRLSISSVWIICLCKNKKKKRNSTVCLCGYEWDNLWSVLIPLLWGGGGIWTVSLITLLHYHIYCHILSLCNLIKCRPLSAIGRWHFQEPVRDGKVRWQVGGHDIRRSPVMRYVCHGVWHTGGHGWWQAYVMGGEKRMSWPTPYAPPLQVLPDGVCR